MFSNFFIFFFTSSDSFAIEALMALAGSDQKSATKTGPEIVSGIRKIEKLVDDDRFVPCFKQIVAFVSQML